MQTWPHAGRVAPLSGPVAPPLAPWPPLWPRGPPSGRVAPPLAAWPPSGPVAPPLAAHHPLNLTSRHPGPPGCSPETLEAAGH